jgi:hypothetical protein
MLLIAASFVVRVEVQSTDIERHRPVANDRANRRADFEPLPRRANVIFALAALALDQTRGLFLAGHTHPVQFGVRIRAEFRNPLFADFDQVFFGARRSQFTAEVNRTSTLAENFVVAFLVADNGVDDFVDERRQDALPCMAR